MLRDDLNRLSSDIQLVISQIEAATGIDIGVEIDESREWLSCSINADRALINTPSQEAFVDGAVLHELLHIRRFLVEGVPKVVLNEERWSPALENVVLEFDNKLEHLVIIPEELKKRPERRERWIGITRELHHKLSIAERPDPFLAVYGWIFSEHVLHDGDLQVAFSALLKTYDLTDRALQFRQEIIPALIVKEDAVRICIEHFEAERELFYLEYLDPRLGQSSLHSLY